MLQSIEAELEKIFLKLNVELFEGCLPKPVFIISSAEIRMQGWGYIMLHTKHGIRVHRTKLSDGVESIVQGLLHQMIHIYCATHNINDVSQQNTYHNKRYQAEAEKRGILMEFKKTRGYLDIGLSEKVQNLVQNSNIPSQYDKIQEILKVEEEIAYKKKMNALTNQEQTVSTHMFKCPSCGRRVFGNESSRIICGWCGMPYVRM